MIRRYSILILSLMLLSGITVAQTSQPAGAKKSVGMKGMSFSPASVTVKVGDTVVWTNDDDRDHTVIGSGNFFKSDNLRPGGSFSFKFTKAGTFTYSCSYHPRMKATIVVTDK